MKKLLFVLTISFTALMSCKKRPELPNPTKADFTTTITSINPSALPDDKNYVIVHNTSGFMSRWTFEGANKTTSDKNTDSLYFPVAGTYRIKLYSYSAGGVDSVTKSVTIDENSKIPANFDYVKIDENHFQVKNTSVVDGKAYWYFPDGTTSNAKIDTIYLPFSGDQNVKLKVELVKGVFIDVAKTITVASTDMSNPNLTDPIFVKLTGGLDDEDGKTWLVCTTAALVDKVDIGSGGVGPYKEKAMDVSYWNYAASQGGYGGSFKNGCAANEYTFIMKNYQYKPLNNKVTVHYDWAFLDFGKPFVRYNDLALEDPNHAPAPFILKNEGIGITGYTLKFGNGSYLAYYDGANRQRYEICKINDAGDSLWVRHKYEDYTTDTGKNQNALTSPEKDGNQRIMVFKLKK